MKVGQNGTCMVSSVFFNVYMTIKCEKILPTLGRLHIDNYMIRCECMR